MRVELELGGGWPALQLSPPSQNGNCHLSLGRRGGEGLNFALGRGWKSTEEPGF